MCNSLKPKMLFMFFLFNHLKDKDMSVGNLGYCYFQEQISLMIHGDKIDLTSVEY